MINERRFEASRRRRIDTATSVAGARAISRRAPSQRVQLLRAYNDIGPGGLTDQQAAQIASLSQYCYWKRCGELRKDELIADTGLTRIASSGSRRMVCAITEKGMRWLRDGSRSEA